MMGIACVIHFLIKQGIHQNTQGKHGKLYYVKGATYFGNKSTIYLFSASEPALGASSHMVGWFGR